LNLQDEELSKHKELVDDVYQKFKYDPNDPEEIIKEIIQINSDNPEAYVMPVPNECLALIIGKNSDTLKLIKNLSGI